MADSNKDFAEHEKTYARFMKITKYSIVVLIVFMLFLYVAINP